MLAVPQIAHSVGRLGPWVLLALLLGACTSEPVDAERSNGGGTENANEESATVEFDVPVGERVFLDLATPEVVETDGADLSWDLAFEGYGVYTNGGLSGQGVGASFGPLSAPTFLSDTAPSVPLFSDEPGGAFFRWYAYDDGHILRSRYHVYAFDDGGRYYKLQILSYYGEALGAPVSALYSVRYAEVTEDGSSETQEALDIDATRDAEGECLNFESGERVRLTAEAARTRSDWHVCFRRDAISVNGGTVGPRGVVAVDLDAALTETERVIDVRSFTPESELPRFEAVDLARLSDPELVYRPDGIASAFTGRWVEPKSDPPSPANSVWLVIGAEGTRHLLAFDGLSGATEETPGRIALRVKSVK